MFQKLSQFNPTERARVTAGAHFPVLSIMALGIIVTLGFCFDTFAYMTAVMSTPTPPTYYDVTHGNFQYKGVQIIERNNGVITIQKQDGVKIIVGGNFEAKELQHPQAVGPVIHFDNPSIWQRGWKFWVFTAFVLVINVARWLWIRNYIFPHSSVRVQKITTPTPVVNISF